MLRLAVHDYAKVFVAGRLAGSISRNSAAREDARAAPPTSQPLQTLVLNAEVTMHADAEGQVRPGIELKQTESVKEKKQNSGGGNGVYAVSNWIERARGLAHGGGD